MLGSGGDRSSSPSSNSLTVDAVDSWLVHVAVNASSYLFAADCNSIFVGATGSEDCFSAAQSEEMHLNHFLGLELQTVLASFT